MKKVKILIRIIKQLKIYLGPNDNNDAGPKKYLYQNG
jgi:hypothetical protein